MRESLKTSFCFLEFLGLFLPIVDMWVVAHLVRNVTQPAKIPYLLGPGMDRFPHPWAGSTGPTTSFSLRDWCLEAAVGIYITCNW
jgi:hypothetical protein